MSLRFIESRYYYAVMDARDTVAFIEKPKSDVNKSSNFYFQASEYNTLEEAKEACIAWYVAMKMQKA